jgi:hypothetical protein
MTANGSPIAPGEETELGTSLVETRAGAARQVT